MEEKKTLLRLIKYITKYRLSVLLVILVMIIASLILVILPFIAENIIDVQIVNKNINGIFKLSFIYIVLVLIWWALSIVRVRVMSKVSNNAILEIRDEVFKHLQTLDLYYFDSRSTGGILSRLIGDISSLKQLLTQLVTILVPNTFFLLSLIIAMLILNPILALGSFISLPIVFIGTFYIMNKNFKRWYEYRQKQSELAGFSHEAFQGIKVIQSLGAEEEEKKNFARINDVIVELWIKCVKIGDSVGIIIDLSRGIGSLFLYLFAIYLLKINQSSIGELIAFSTYITLFWNPIRTLSQMYNQLSNNLSGASRVFEILDEESSIIEKENVKDLPHVEGNVSFSNVSFAYPDEKDKLILKNVSFTVKKGEKIALVGPTGAGKTTIINLISRFYDPTSGSVLIDGYDIKDYSVSSLRNNVGVMTQESFLFSGSILDNLRYGAEDASFERVKAACCLIGCDDFISHFGYDSKINELNLSVGQKQLIALARTLIRDPKILILDEATSSIDTNTEIKVQKGIQTLMEGRTCFIVAHRLSTIRNSDRIFVIADGIVVEEGNHEELLIKDGYYATLYRAQFE